MTSVLQVLGRSAGGIARHVAQVTESLDGTDGLTVDIASPPDLIVRMPKPVLPLDIPDGPTGGHVRAIARLVSLLGEYDVVHAHGLRAGIDAGLAARRARTRSLLTVHNLVRAEITGRGKALLYRRAEAAAVWATDRTFAVSQDIARHLALSVPRSERKIEVLYLGIGEPPIVRRSREDVRADLGLDADSALIVTVARLAPQKALTVLFEAMQLCSTEAVVAIVGEGPSRLELEEWLHRHDLRHRIHLLGFREDVADLIAAADIFCLSSIWEGVPLSAQEAILLGVPVVATDVGGMRELISNKVSGRLVPSGDPEALSDAIDELLRDGSLRTRYAEAARSSLHDRFSTDAMLDRLRRAYVG